MVEKEKSLFIRRAFFLGIFQIGLVALLLLRMVNLQIIQGPYYQLLADGNRIATRPILPSRGQLYDRKGVPLAQNESSFRIVLLTDRKNQIQEVLETLSTLITISPKETEEALKAALRQRGLDSLIIKDKLTWNEVSILELHASELPGLSLEVGSSRKYPHQEEGAHVLGYIASPSEKEQEADSMLSIPGLKVGKVGLEKHFDKRLRGFPGHRALEVNAQRKIVRDLHQVESQPGEDIFLTLDHELQSYAQDILASYESASVVVLDLKNGDILSLVSTPSFDPNLFPQGISHKDWGELRDNPYVPMTNKAISGLYAPGSTIKLLVALSALQANVVDPSTTVYCPGYMYLGNHKFHCWKKGGHGTVNVSRALSESCDVFMYETAKKIGIEKLSILFKELGLGEGGIEGFPHAKKGLVPTKEWKQKKKNANWTVSDTILTSIGQGYVLTTPLELATVIARIASGGKRLTPRLEGKGPVDFPDMGYDPQHLFLLLEQMNATVNSPSGTAFRWRIPIQGMEMAGKTGTSQVRRITMKQRKAGQTKTTHMPWKYREHGLFIGYAPVHAPRYAIAVVIEHSGGASLAVQVARDILLKAQQMDQETNTP